jgi:hypothetical protein
MIEEILFAPNIAIKAALFDFDGPANLPPSQFFLDRATG